MATGAVSERPGRGAAWATLLAGAAGLVVLALWLVPWDPVPATVPSVAAGDFFTPAQLAEAEEFSGTARAWSLASLAVSLAVVCGLGFTRAGSRLVQRLPGRWWVQVVLAVVAVSLLVRVVTLPFAAALHSLRRDAGLSTQSWSGLWLDLAKGELVDVVATSLAMLLLIGLARRWPRVWPAVAGALLAALVVLGSFVYPLLVEPLFNRFEPLEAGTLRTEVIGLAESEGVQLDEVLVADASRRTTTLNAWVSGIGETRRVALYDNLVEEVPEDQVLSVVAHELAHARHGDVVVGTVLGSAGVLAAVGLLGLLLGRGDGGCRLARPVVVPTVLAMVSVGTLLASPVENAVSRRIEARADVSALCATADPAAFVALQRSLALRSLADPAPPAWVHAWWGSHPTVLERIALARWFEEAVSRSWERSC